MVGLTMTEKVLQLGALAKSLLGSGLVLDPLNPPTEIVTPPTHRVLLFPINLSLKFPFPPSVIPLEITTLFLAHHENWVFVWFLLL